MSFIRRQLVLFLCTFLLITCKEKVAKKTTNWISLFNGKDLTDWTVKINGYPLGKNPHKTFRVENGVLKVSYDGYTNFNKSYGHIFYKNPFSNYILRLSYRFVGKQVAGGQDWATKNSGIMIHAQSPESMALQQEFPVSLEVQLLGGLDQEIARPTANLCTPGTHVKINKKLTTQHCINSSSLTFYGEEWVDIEVEVHNDSLISHKVNGKEVISYSKPTFGGDFNPFPSKKGNPIKSGYISLQSESHPVEFKHIQLLELE